MSAGIFMRRGKFLLQVCGNESVDPSQQQISAILAATSAQLRTWPKRYILNRDDCGQLRPLRHGRDWVSGFKILPAEDCWVLTANSHYLESKLNQQRIASRQQMLAVKYSQRRIAGCTFLADSKRLLRTPASGELLGVPSQPTANARCKIQPAENCWMYLPSRQQTLAVESSQRRIAQTLAGWNLISDSSGLLWEIKPSQGGFTARFSVPYLQFFILVLGYTEMDHKEGAQVDGSKRRRQEMLLGIRADLEEAEISWEGSINRDKSMDGLSTTVWASGQLYMCSKNAENQGKKLPSFTGQQITNRKADLQIEKATTTRERKELRERLCEMKREMEEIKDSLAYLDFRVKALGEIEEELLDLEVIANSASLSWMAVSRGLLDRLGWSTANLCWLGSIFRQQKFAGYIPLVNRKPLLSVGDSNCWLGSIFRQQKFAGYIPPVDRKPLLSGYRIHLASLCCLKIRRSRQRIAGYTRMLADSMFRVRILSSSQANINTYLVVYGDRVDHGPGLSQQWDKSSGRPQTSAVYSNVPSGELLDRPGRSTAILCYLHVESNQQEISGYTRLTGSKLLLSAWELLRISLSEVTGADVTGAKSQCIQIDGTDTQSKGTEGTPLREKETRKLSAVKRALTSLSLSRAELRPLSWPRQLYMVFRPTATHLFRYPQQFPCRQQKFAAGQPTVSRNLLLAGLHADSRGLLSIDLVRPAILRYSDILSNSLADSRSLLSVSLVYPEIPFRQQKFAVGQLDRG
ncbi:hypothetical protein BDP27DRAFT_1369430 [Rhodocollybia butyracea]|uniref:Uncharacterized protein n=1 Tax=Rhodocollybia butyracea TaxID=206335 RepID=A0A9P5U0R5_9AGAR|nr:hypothetical protein BDP27DRAFT_1369430 [Rhodocollybia butyracea]